MHKAHPFSISVTSRLVLVFGGLAIGLTVVAISIFPSSRQCVSKALGSRPSAAVIAFLLAAFALANFKNLPFMWHVGFLRSFFYQLWLQPNPQTPRYLFAPLVTEYRNTILDCDYNFHKSNSTYFADLDLAHAHAVGLVLRTGLARLNRGDQSAVPESVVKAPGRYGLALGGVSCSFRKQIEPLQPFEIYTRLLTWDKKWLYFVSHIVQKGVIMPRKYVLQPGKKKGQTTSEEGKSGPDLKPHIFATSIAKYVGKKGRLTLNPEILLEWSRLLPARPAGVEYPPNTETSTTERSTGSAALPHDNETRNFEDPAADVDGNSISMTGKSAPLDLNRWTWEDMESERLSGLEIAAHFDALSGLEKELRTEDILGRFGAYW